MSEIKYIKGDVVMCMDTSGKNGLFYGDYYTVMGADVLQDFDFVNQVDVFEAMYIVKDSMGNTRYSSDVFQLVPTKLAQCEEVVEVDLVNEPPHYKAGGIETLDFIKAKLSKDGYSGFLEGNIIKYITRYKLKNGVQDLRKAEFYLRELIEHESVK